jgi:hypothetical protein
VRLLDYRCGFCGRARLDVVIPDGGEAPKCCAHSMERMPVAPRLSGVKRMGQVGYGKEMTVKEIDQKLAKEGSWVASENERRQVRQMSEAGIDPVIIKKRPDTRKHVEQAMQILKAKGQA